LFNSCYFYGSTPFKVVKTKRMLKYIFPLVLILAACGSNEKPEKSSEKEKPKVVVSFANEGEMDERMAEIDAIVQQSGLVASSLYYAKGETGESFQVEGHMNADNTIMKIEEFFNDGNGLSSGRRMYYLNGGSPFITHERFDDVSGSKPQFVERISYYDEKGVVLKTKERRSDYEEAIDAVPYKPVGVVSVSMDKAMRALNQEKEFKTTFQGFIYQEIFTYISVGENKPDGFRSALRLDYKDALIAALSGNTEGYLGEEIRVNYEKHTDETGFEFQVYAGGKFADQK